MIYKKEIQINPMDSVCLIGKRRFAAASQNFSGKKKEIPGFFRHFHLIFALLVIAGAVFSPHLVFAAQVTLAWPANSEADLAGYRPYLLK